MGAIWCTEQQILQDKIVAVNRIESRRRPSVGTYHNNIACHQRDDDGVINMRP